jgi:hypothetical protein
LRETAPLRTWRNRVTEVNTDLHKDEKVNVVRTGFNVANTVAAIALLLLVLGLLKWMGVSPF